ncbi:MAG TPA: haloalkane dehalogenase [Bradyrhizobium sp.]|jgi:haloalkane dehalogenase|uniref:haloalkane dehalogenase n=1 Tax=Bradyrhizobium sp. TaxID=376 RepID=UPI002C367AA0|nr:haloalkane dehalogenase [Bradyrhizobium sp.]HXB80021.1 haloalkane dehalogenase [Bradyrhizobium sp.]
MTEQPLIKKTIDILDARMAYHERGEGRPVLFLHGNPTSSYLWRDVIPELEGLGRLVAPDLIGMGDSTKLASPGPDTYRFATHRKYLWAFIEQVIGGSESLVLVVHDWGSALGFDWANHHRGRVRGIAYMEAIVRPIGSWDEWSKAATPIFQAFRSDKGEQMILERNMFVERVLPGSVLRKLTDAEMIEYRKPFLKAEHRWPTLTWPRQIPILGEPADVVQIVSDYAQWMAQNEMPKLFVNAEPGAILIGAVRDFCRSWKSQTEVTVTGSHFVQEDSGPAIGRAVADWIKANAL